MDAYEYLDKQNHELINETNFNQLINEFQNRYLDKENYNARLKVHRNPVEVMQTLYRGLCDYSLHIQNRPEMRDINEEKKIGSYVPSVIKELWMEDRHLRTLYRTILHYCELRKKDVRTIAVHMAEYRAVTRLQRWMKRDIRIFEQRDVKHVTSYTFEDWLSNNFYREKTYAGDHVANDSENYLQLVSAGKMTYDVLNRIQEAQQEAYDYMIQSSLRLNQQQFKRQTKDSLDIRQVIEFKIQEIGKYFGNNQAILKEVMLPRKHRGIKWGAKFLLPEHYRAAINKDISDVHIPVQSPYSISVNGSLVSCPTPEQMKYAIMEVQVRWLRILHSYGARMRFEQMVSSPDFKSLIDNYGNAEELMEQYLQGLSFAPDRELFIRNRIATYESVVPRFQSSIIVKDRQNAREIKVQTGEYKNIGYAWVNNGYNAKSVDFEGSTLRNVTLCNDVPAEERYSVYVQVLSNLAEGGAIAFHLAFLREELKRSIEPLSGKQSTRKKIGVLPVWRGSEDQRLRLYDLLAEESFMENKTENRSAFLNNKLVHWKSSDRLLFYMLSQLKEKAYKLIDQDEDLTPLLNNNFKSKHGLPFKNVSQSLNGMVNNNANSKPRHAAIIDKILEQLK